MNANSHNVKQLENLGKARKANVFELTNSILGMNHKIDEMMIAIFFHETSITGNFRNNFVNSKF